MEVINKEWLKRIEENRAEGLRKNLDKVRSHHKPRLGSSIYISKIIVNNRQNKRVELVCQRCGTTSNEWTSQLVSGSWSVCEHDLD